jgi:hypothetical protein
VALATPTSLYAGGVADTAAGDPWSPASITTVAGRLYLAFVECPNVTVTSLTLPGTITMTEIGTHIRGTLTRITAFYGICSVGGSGSPSVDFSGAVTGAALDVWEISSGFDTSTPIIAANYIESDGTDASAPTTIDLTLPNALTRAGNMTVLAAVCNSNTAWTADTPHVERTDVGYNTPNRTLAAQYAIGPGTQLCSGEFTLAAAQWAALAFEVNESAAGGGSLLVPRRPERGLRMR